MRRLDFAVLAAGVAAALLIATDVVPALRGPQEWRWGRRPLDSFWPLLANVAIFAGSAAVAFRVRRIWGVAGDFRRAAWLAAAVALVVAQMLALIAAEPGGLSNLARRVLDPSFTSYHTVARRVEDPAAFLRRYHEIQAGFPVHGPSQPPGRVLFFRAVNGWASEPGRTRALLALGERLGGVPKGPPRTTDGQRAGAVAAALLLVALGALAIVPLTVIAGGRCEPEAAGSAVLLASCLPSFVLFTPQTDHLVLLLTSSAAALGLEVMRWASRPAAPLLAFAAGLCASGAVFVSFTSLASLAAWGLAILGMGLFARFRNDPYPTPARLAVLVLAATGGLAVVPAWTAAIGMDWPAVFREATSAAHRVQVLVHGRRYGTWVVWNVVDFVVFLGPALAVAWLARVGDEARAARPGIAAEPHGPPIEAPFAIALLVALLALDVSGRILGETGRIWMFFMPLAVVAVALGSRGRSDREILPLAAGQLAVLLALRGFWNVPG
jgi:hypothetical protein